MNLPLGETVWLTSTMSMRCLADLGTLSLDSLEIGEAAVKSATVHENMDEILYILEGSLDVGLNGIWRTYSTGDAIPVPRGTSHESVNRSGRAVRMLAMNSPAFSLADFEQESS